MSDKLFENINQAPAAPSKEEAAKTSGETNITGDNDADNEEDDDLPNELDLLKQRAKMMGITFSNNIGLEALREKVNAKMTAPEEPVNPALPVAEVPAPAPVIQEPVVQQAPVVPEPPLVQPTAKAAPAKPKTLRQYLYEREMKLVRVRIQNLDPKDADLPGEIFTVANEYLGTVRIMVPFGEVTDNGWHVPVCILRQIKARQFLQIRVRKRNGREVIEQNWVRKFSIEELPPLDAEGLSKLATQQAMQAGQGD